MNELIILTVEFQSFCELREWQFCTSSGLAV